jgi:hypothetical protein
LFIAVEILVPEKSWHPGLLNMVIPTLTYTELRLNKDKGAGSHASYKNYCNENKAIYSSNFVFFNCRSCFFES